MSYSRNPFEVRGGVWDVRECHRVCRTSATDFLHRSQRCCFQRVTVVPQNSEHTPPPFSTTIPLYPGKLRVSGAYENSTGITYRRAYELSTYGLFTQCLGSAVWGVERWKCGVGCGAYEDGAGFAGSVEACKVLERVLHVLDHVH